MPVPSNKTKLTNIAWTLLIVPPVFLSAFVVAFLLVLSHIVYIKGADAVGDSLVRLIEYLLRLRKHKIVMSSINIEE